MSVYDHPPAFATSPACRISDTQAHALSSDPPSAGFASAELSGEDNADEMRIGPDGGIVFQSNHAGGVLGGISTGQPLTARIAFKPTSSILTPRQTVTRDGTETDLRTIGRHDPCVALRGVPVVEAMAACVLADAWLRHRAQQG